MINFNNLNPIVHEKYSFVGIQQRNGKLEFCLPKGFADKLDQVKTFEVKRDLFFLFYRIFSQFKQICLAKTDPSKLITSDRDGTLEINQGSGIVAEEEQEKIIFYSKLDMLSGILNAYDEPKILSLVYRLGQSDQVDYSKLHKHLHHAVYLPNHAAYVDYMILPRKQVQFESTDIVAMYCYLLWEIKQQLDENIGSELKALAERFQEQYLKAEYSLFDEKSYHQVINLLKDSLEIIDHNTPLKDADYWELYEAIELFLYGEMRQDQEEEVWGINNFHSVWESMCLTYIARNNKLENVLYLDTQFISDNISQSLQNMEKVIDLSNAFKINGSILRPDAVIYRSFEKNIPKREYIITQHPLNDDGYLTTLRDDSYFVFKVAYIEQKKHHYTISKLNNFYTVKNGNLHITKRLPEQFYSFWTLEEELDSEAIYKMYYFNHLFYLALSKNIKSGYKFKEKILKPLGFNKSTVLDISVFRGYSEEKVIINFEKFLNSLEVKKWIKGHALYFEMIDIKYFDLTYYLNNQNQENIKQKSVKKQLIYEYLLEQHIDQTAREYTNVPIQSYFWLPAYDQDTLVKEHPQFMNESIKLITVDFETIAKDYISNSSVTPDVILSSFQTKSQSQVSWSVGEQVFHDDFGIGVITRIAGRGVFTSLEVSFDKMGQKFLSLHLSYLKKVIKAADNDINWSTGDHVFHDIFGKGEITNLGSSKLALVQFEVVGMKIINLPVAPMYKIVLN